MSQDPASGAQSPEPTDLAAADVRRLASEVNEAIDQREWAEQRGMDRRGLLRAGALVGAGAIGSSLVAACGGSSSSSASASSGGGSKGPNRAGIVIAYPQSDGTAGFFQTLKNGADQAASDLGVSVNFKSNSGTDFGAAQAELTTTLIATNPTGLMTGVWDASAMQAPVTSAVKKGIATVIINATPNVETPPFGALTFVGQSDYLGGERAAQYFKANGAQHPMIVNSFPGTANIQQRVEGFTAGFGSPAPLVVTVANGSSSPTALLNAVKGTLQSHSNVDAVMLVDTDSAATILGAKQGGQLSKSLKVGTFDYTSALLNDIESGALLFAVDQQQYLQGYMGVVTITMYKSLGFGPVRSFLTGPSIVDQAKAKQALSSIKSGARTA